MVKYLFICDGDEKFFGLLTPEMVLHDLGNADIAAHSETQSKRLVLFRFSDFSILINYP